MIHILLVDDDKDQLAVLERFLTLFNSDFHIVTAISGQDALELLVTHSFDVIVSDYQMPGLDGLQLLEQLRQTNQMIPFIMFTGKGREEVAIQALNLGADYYLRKEGEVRSLYQELAHIIQKVVIHAHTQKELKVSEEKYRDLVENISDAMYILDAEGRIAYSSPSIKSIIGYNSLDIIGLSIVDFIHPEDKERALKGIEEILSGTLEPHEYRVLDKSGDIRWIRTSSKPIHSQDGFIGLRGVMTDITDRKHAEEALKRSEEVFRRTFNALIDPAYLWERQVDGRIILTEVNHAAFQANRQEIPDSLDAELDEVFSERPRIISAIREVFQTGQKKREEMLYEYTDGREPKWLHVDYIRVKRDMVLVIAQNITKQKKAAEALRESEARYRRLAENASDVIYRISLSPSLNFEYVSPAITKMTGYTPEEHYQDPELATKLVHPEDRHLVENLRKSPPPAGTPIIVRWIGKDGQVIWTERQNVPIYDADGNLIATEGIIRDITGRKHAEEALRTSEETFRRTFEAIPDPAYLWERQADGEVILIKANTTAFEITEGRVSNFMGIELNQHYANQPEIIKTVMSVMETGEAKQEEMAYRFQTLQVEKWLLIEYVKPSEGRVLVVTKDMTDRKRAETQILQQKEELSEFAHTMAHDLRNRLLSIEGYAKLLQEDYSRIETEKIRRLAQDTMKLLQRSVDLADAGLVAEKIDNVNLSQLMENVAESTIPNTIIFLHDLPPDFFVRGDREKLIQVFQNLFENAVIHGIPKKIEIQYIKTEKGHRLTIKNDGTAISPQYRSKIFQNGFTSRESGRGMGLKIIQKIIQAHQWKIRLEGSEETAFCLFIPK